tara:strand:- start:5595 stop:6290 length:696 start_codon:yes stop_codon:yes gene_type:complete
MGTLNDRFQYVWYGTCQEETCTELKFADLPSDTLSKIDSISGLTNTGFSKYDPSSSDVSTLDSFVCGKMYLVTLNPSAVVSGGVELPNSLASSSMSKLQRYGISTTCSEVKTPTPSPTPVQLCIPEDYTKVDYAEGAGISLGDLGSGSFAEVGNLGYNLAEFPSGEGLPVLYFINIPSESGNKLAVAMVASRFPTDNSEPDIIFEADNGSCYRGKLIKNSADDNWTANLSE